jgi:hypothetical protein
MKDSGFDIGSEQTEHLTHMLDEGLHQIIEVIFIVINEKLEKLFV